MSHITNCYESGLFFNPKLLRGFANELLQIKGNNEIVGKNWLSKFYERHFEIKSRFVRPMQKQRVLNKNADNYIEWFRHYEETIIQWAIVSGDIYNIDESGASIGFKYYSRIIVSIIEKDAISPTNGNREWATLIEIINAIGEALSAFYVLKGESLLEDYEEFWDRTGDLVKSIKNGWSNNKIAIDYLKHFIYYTRDRRIGEYILLILDGHDSHATFRFKQLAIDNKIILLYLPAHTTHRL